MLFDTTAANTATHVATGLIDTVTSVHDKCAVTSVHVFTISDDK